MNPVYEDYRPSRNCRICGMPIEFDGLCIPCGRLMYKPCGVSKSDVKVKPTAELYKLKGWLEEELNQRRD